MGVFGLSLYTEERDLRQVFERYGPVDEVQVVFDHQTGRSRGFAFVYMRSYDDAVEASVSCLHFFSGFPCLLESPGFFLDNSRTWKVPENHVGSGKSWKLKIKVLESPGKISLKVVHFLVCRDRMQISSSEF